MACNLRFPGIPKSIPTLTLAALALIIAASAAAQPPGSAQSCVGCHGEDGYSSDPNTPKIGGASDFYLENQLFLFQMDMRPCVADLFAQVPGTPADNHCAVVADLSESEIDAIGDHYSAQPARAAEQSISAEEAQAGQTIYEAACARCHTAAGSDPEDDAGILAGQWKPYLVRTITDFREGRRMLDERPKRAAKDLSDSDIQALAAFFASQKP